MVVHESRVAPGDNFVQSSAAPAEKQLTLRIALKQNNIAGLEAELYKVSDASVHLRQHLTLKEVVEFIKPTNETLAAVSSWLSENNVDARPITPVVICSKLSSPVSRANALLSVKFSVFTHITTRKAIIRTLEYSLTAELTKFIEFLVAASRGKRAAPVANDLPGECASGMTPACLQRIPTTPATQRSTTLGVAGFIDDFLTRFRPDFDPSTTFALETLNGGSNPQNRSQAGVEAVRTIICTLRASELTVLRYTIGLATGVPVTFISAGDDNTDDDLGGFLGMAILLIDDPNRPSVLNTSYGSQLSVVRGAPTLPTSFHVPERPFDSVTSVGSTGGINQSPDQRNRIDVLFWGHFLTTFPFPAYQAQDVAAYLAFIDSLGTIPESGRFNRSGRGFPDVSAQGENFPIVLNGEFVTVEGTSCSSPPFASLVAVGKPTLGFLNPFLYSPAGHAALNDVLFGDNLGTPNFPGALRTAVGL
ncbi:Tripeptidyl-peptidase sed3 [Favolaschia claudopus]|uniref:Tripeptidyl-peptidase sed3 n=1 Tax=Favolaschia claudopus TaxID=2862362 RepID=A0AAW0AGF8_9AGAR